MRPGSRYFAALLGALGIFSLFVALEYRGTITPFRSVAAASVLCAAAAALFARRWPRHSWLWGMLLSAVFTAYLVVVFGFLTADGRIDAWPLVDATIIASASCAGGLAGRAWSTGLVRRFASAGRPKERARRTERT